MNLPTTNHSRVLIMTAVEAEREAVLRGLGSPDFIDVELAGVGPASAAARTARVLAGKDTAWSSAPVSAAGLRIGPVSARSSLPIS